jgi:hypothetical protein
MPRSRRLTVWTAMVVGIAVAMGAFLSSAADQDNGLETQDRRGAVIAASNVFVGQVVGEELRCLATSWPDHYVVYDTFFVTVERNVKGRVEGTVVVRQDTDDTGHFGTNGRLMEGKKYLLITRYLSEIDAYALVDDQLGYERIDSPEERAELVAEVRDILNESITSTPTIDPDTLATWDALSTVRAATQAAYPTPFPCGPEVIATATAAADALNRENRAVSVASGPPPENATPWPGP